MYLVQYAIVLLPLLNVSHEKGMSGKKLHPYLGVLSLRISCNNVFGDFFTCI